MAAFFFIRRVHNQIEAEDKHKPLSDQKIADYLKNEKGIYIARRTVTKYREQLKIPAAYKRKIQKEENAG